MILSDEVLSEIKRHAEHSVVTDNIQTASCSTDQQDYNVSTGCVRDDDASPEHASSANVWASAAAHAGPPRNACAPPIAAASDAQGEQARNTN
ncbi:unnamed protein product [Euphydryas editha]|uniref:Uncharacterized protein n=1 Tax=Euphydryas editha TaxID=104508 RepID=A0AAU9UTZ0_EUPED|nr:unnamed protein product [Euphydryas editha]